MLSGFSFIAVPVIAFRAARDVDRATKNNCQTANTISPSIKSNIVAMAFNGLFLVIVRDDTSSYKLRSYLLLK